MNNIMIIDRWRMEATTGRGIMNMDYVIIKEESGFYTVYKDRTGKLPKVITSKTDLFEYLYVL